MKHSKKRDRKLGPIETTGEIVKAVCGAFGRPQLADQILDEWARGDYRWRSEQELMPKALSNGGFPGSYAGSYRDGKS